MIRLATMEMSLRQQTVGLCARTSSATGIVVDYIGAYADEDRDFVRQETELTDVPTVIGVVPGSPAEAAGIKPGDEILAISGRSPETIAESSPDPILLANQLEEELASQPGDHPIQLRVQRAGQDLTYSISPLTLCAARIILKTEGGIDAHSDDRLISVTSKFLRFTQNDDELALLVGHELAHIVAGDMDAKSLRARRAMEDRADILGADLARCAGFDVRRGIGWWQRYNQKDWLRWIRSPSHRNTPDRIAQLQAHLAAGPPSCPPQVPSL